MNTTSGAFRVLLGWLAWMLVACAIDGTTPDYRKTPVLFIHGAGMSSNTWKPMIGSLVQRGYPREYLLAVDIKPKNVSNVRAAHDVIAPAVDRLLHRAGKAAKSHGIQPLPSQVDLVAHSMGAVSSRWYAAKIAPERVRVWISLAGSNHGTDVAIGHSDPGVREIAPGFAESVKESTTQIELNGPPSAPIDESPHGLGIDRLGVVPVPPAGDKNILYLTIFIDPDRVIQPETSALLDGAGGINIRIPTGISATETRPGNFEFKGSTNHDALPKNKSVIDLVAAMLHVRD